MPDLRDLGASRKPDPLLTKFAPVYVLFPEGTFADVSPSKSRRSDYQPIAVEEFLNRAMAVPVHPADLRAIRALSLLSPVGILGLQLTKFPTWLALKLIHVRIVKSPVVLSMSFGLALGAIVFAALGGVRSLEDLVIVAAFMLGPVLPHTFVHLSFWPKGADQIKAATRRYGGINFVLTFPHTVWPEEIWSRYGHGELRTPPTIYGRRTSWGDGDSRIALQYWAYYLYNDWANRHESDWEVVTLFLDGGGKPGDVVYSVHEGAIRRKWDQAERIDDAGELSPAGSHPVAYVAVGSHAQYFVPQRGGYQTWLTGQSPFGNPVTVLSARDDDLHRDDVVDVQPEELAVTDHYSVVEIPDWIPGRSGDEPADQFWWLAFPGRWGREDGPHSPAFQGLKWTSPRAWAARDSVASQERLDV